MKILTPKEVLENEAAPYWVKKALSMALEREPLAAMNEVNLLANVIREHAFNEIRKRTNG